MQLRHYWFEFDFPAGAAVPSGIERGCGASAFDRDDAQHLLREIVFAGGPLPPVHRCIEDVTDADLAALRVARSHRPLKWRGVWYPLGYSAYNSLVPEKGRPVR